MFTVSLFVILFYLLFNAVSCWAFLPICNIIYSCIFFLSCLSGQWPTSLSSSRQPSSRSCPHRSPVVSRWGRRSSARAAWVCGGWAAHRELGPCWGARATQSGPGSVQSAFSLRLRVGMLTWRWALTSEIDTLAAHKQNKNPTGKTKQRNVFTVASFLCLPFRFPWRRLWIKTPCIRSGSGNVSSVTLTLCQKPRVAGVLILAHVAAFCGVLPSGLPARCRAGPSRTWPSTAPAEERRVRTPVWACTCGCVGTSIRGASCCCAKTLMEKVEQRKERNGKDKRVIIWKTAKIL